MSKQRNLLSFFKKPDGGTNAASSLSHDTSSSAPSSTNKRTISNATFSVNKTNDESNVKKAKLFHTDGGAMNDKVYLLRIFNICMI